MAVENKWIDTTVEAGGRGHAAKVAGGKLLCIAGNFEVAAADSNLSVYKLAMLPANAIPVKFDVMADGSIDGTDFDFGLYTKAGVEVDKDILADGLDLASGEPITAPLNGLTNLGGADPLAAVGKRLYELLGLTAVTKNREEYALAMTANVAGGAAGTISYYFWYIIG